MGDFRAALVEELRVITKTEDPAPVVAFAGCTTGGEPPKGLVDPGAEPFAVEVPRDLAGLALSGGGIRSATFNLGLLQGLNERKLLDHFDYVTTVSGGGYVGSFWSVWRKREEMKPEEERELFPADTSTQDDCKPPASRESELNARAEPEPIRHLREFSRFLAVRWGLFELETWQFFSAVVTAIIPALIVGFSMIALLIWYVLILGANSMGGRGYTMALVDGWQLSYLAMTLLIVGVSTVYVMSSFEVDTRARERLEDEPFFQGTYLVSATIATLIALGVVYRIVHGAKWRYFEIFPGLHPTADDRMRFFAPAIGWATAMLTLIALRTLASRFVTQPSYGFYRAAIDRVSARLLAMTIFWAVMIVFVFLAFVIWSRHTDAVGFWTTGVGAGSGGAYAWIQRYLSRQPNRATSGLLGTIVSRYALPLLATAALVAAALGITCLIFTAIARDHALLSALLPVGVLAVAVVFYNPNEMGLHSVYRSRLSRAYLGAANPKTMREAYNRQSTERPDDDLLLRDLPESRPVHLICVAANDLNGNHLANLSRGARSSTLSRFGFTLANRFQSWAEAPAQVSLATAMTASAAAFNSNMGSLSMELGQAATFLLASLNLRLGYWYRFTKARTLLPGLDLLYEMLSKTDSGPEANSVHLSDGAHFENLGLYELLRRRCRYILVSDCGADPDVAFDDVGNALRRAREDFGVQIDIDLGVLKPNEKRYSRQHVAVGDVTYPDGDRGILLLFKPTLIGDEPGDVLQYRARNLQFPHESTGDQFYDEKQWESYRRLGLHAARAAFRFLDGYSDSDTPTVMQVFGDARWEWLPVPAALQGELLSRASELDAIDRQLMASTNEGLLRDVFPELAWPADAPHIATDAKTMAKILPLFTQVMTLMENVYVSCEMERYASHPLTLGWLNFFGRWATTPAFRDYWPLLAPMFNPRMTRFFEENFCLLSTRNPKWTLGDTAPTDRKNSVAYEMWKGMNGGVDPAADLELVSYRVPIESDGRKVDVAILFFKVEDGTKKWNDNDFFIPPSFWGARIGSAFLDEMARDRQFDGPLEVTINNDSWRRKEISDTVQLYRQAHFEIVKKGGTDIVMRRERLPA